MCTECTWCTLILEDYASAMADDATPCTQPRLSEQHLAELRASVAEAEYGSEQEALDDALARWRVDRAGAAGGDLSLRALLDARSRGAQEEPLAPAEDVLSRLRARAEARVASERVD